MRNILAKIMIATLLISMTSIAYGQAFTKDDPIGTVVEYQQSDKKDNIERMTLVQKKSTPRGQELTIRIGSDEDFEMKCLRTDTEFIWDANNLTYLIQKSIDENDIKFRIKTKGDGLSIPLQPKLNDKYRDLKFKLTMSIYGIKPKVNIAITDREIIRTEVVETPMGKFDTYLLRSKWNLHIKLLLLVNERETFEMYQWIVPGLGVVKEITVDEDDNLDEATAKILVKKYVSDSDIDTK